MEDQKHTAESIMELINSLPIMERIKLHDLFKGVQTASSDMEEYLTEQRFSGGRVWTVAGRDTSLTRPQDPRHRKT